MRQFNFKYIGSDTGRNFEESIEHVRGSAKYLWGDGHAQDKIGPERFLKDIENGEAVFYRMELLGDYYYAGASLKLIQNFDIENFKLSLYIATKLKILGQEESDWGYTSTFFPIIFGALMSDSTTLKKFLIEHQSDIVGTVENNLYSVKNFLAYSNLNILLAIAGKWDDLKKRVIIFLNEEDKIKKKSYRFFEYEFYLALCERNREAMIDAMNKMLEKKFVKKVMYGVDVFFDFYLQMQALVCAKIAAIHGFDLGIDSVYAPKELIEYKPLEKYEDPYDFMKEFDYNQPQQVWIDKYNEKMRLAKEAEEQKKKKGIFSRLFKW